MSEHDPTRRLLALVSGDVVGYARHMAADEAATIALLAAHRETLGSHVVANHGRLVDFTGDNFLAEFGSAHHALRCAVDFQRQTVGDIGGLEPAQALQFRLGAHVGDVRIDGDKIYGNGVNIASRLEGIAEPGGICLSQQIYDQVLGQFDISYVDLGEQQLKNIPQPIRAYQISANQLHPNGDRLEQQTGATTSVNSSAIPAIAVLPVVNLSSDAEQEHLADAITADIITGLSCDRRFSIIAFNSVMQFKGQSTDIAEIGNVLGVRYVVESTIRKMGPRFRISIALIDVATRRELWGDKLDRQSEEFFEVFDDLIEALVTALGSHLKMAEVDRYRRQRPEQLDAWALATRASAIFFLNPTTTLDETQALVDAALEADPDYAFAWAIAGFLTAFKFPLGLSEDHPSDVAQSLALTDKALKLDPGDPWNLVAKAVALQYGGRPAESMEFLQRSLRLNPSDVFAHCYYGRGLMFSGKADDALAHFERFSRLNPNDPGAHMAGMYHALALLFLHRWPECEHVARQSVAAAAGRNGWSLVILLIALGGQEKLTDAQALLPTIANVVPHWSPAFVAEFFNQCQEDKACLPVILDILERVWPS